MADPLYPTPDTEPAKDPTVVPSKPMHIHETKSGKIFLLTDNHVFELLDGKWQPTVFAEPPRP